MASTSDIKNGLVNTTSIYKIIASHVMGKVRFCRTKLRSLSNGKVLDNTFSAGHKIEEVRLKIISFNFISEGDDFHFMNTRIF
jgi:elongation factor P